MILNNQAAFCGGDAAVAAMSIVGRVSFLIFAVGLGIGQGYQPVAAFNYGAGRYSRVKEGYRFCLLAGEAALCLLAVLCMFFVVPVVAWFRNDPAVIDIGSRALRYACIACFFQPLCVTTNMMFQSIGKSGRATFLALLRNGLYFIPLILILPRIIGMTGVETAQMFADMLAGLTAIPLAVQFLEHLPPDHIEGERH